MDNNIHEVGFGNSTLTQIEQLYQYDKGQILKITDKVEDGTEVQFSNNNSEITINKAINDSQVEIPDILLQENKKILAYLKIINSDSETTIKTVIIPVKARTKPADYIEPEQEKPFRRYVEEKLENAEKLVAEANDKVKVNEECLKQIDIKTEQSVNQIAEVTNGKIKDLDSLVIAKMGDLANTTNAKLTDINNTAVSQIEAINSSATAAGESQIKGINTVASSQISNITNVTNQQLNNINATVTHQIGIIEGKTSTQIESINNTATSQISAINSTALSQIDAINNTTTNQIKNMTVKYSDMCRTLGIEHEGMINITRNKNVPIDVRKYKYIKFGTANTKGGGFKDYTLPPKNDWCSIHCDKKEIDFTKPSDSLFEVTSNKEYDISTFDDLYLRYSSMDNTDYGYINYKLYNKSEETTEE
ncbi:hypothetical protein [Eubacterium sp. CAG:156]|uniref:hypothetical protein n=1 Tax=Eubacterium sp. CAG:156 TaxID=1262880 RepID=UPI00033B4876|nr:putative uncharacterized protein [Eubacterium sp. CAG:156]